MLGLFHKDLLSYQDKHYEEIGSRRTGTASWSKHMAIKLWNLTYQMWAARNECLHDSVTVHEFKGLEVLHSSMLTELDRGIRSLPLELYSQHFQHTDEEILSLDIDDKKAWFLLIRSARELYMDAPIDNFTCDDLLREWIGLSPIAR